MTRAAEIAAMDRASLLKTWQSVFERPAPKGLSQNMLRRFLAFDVQAKAQGGLNRSTRAYLSSAKPKKTQSTKLKPGGRLIREWNGVTHIVDVTEGGFEWRGQTWRSLSAIAREITGAHWSGPRFFGLNT
ncbi:MAG: DUF2924 domain-containing protein [Pseudomonadota bacterium]